MGQYLGREIQSSKIGHFFPLKITFHEAFNTLAHYNSALQPVFGNIKTPLECCSLYMTLLDLKKFATPVNAFLFQFSD